MNIEDEKDLEENMSLERREHQFIIPSFIKYCKKFPIDMKLLNSLPDNIFYSISENSYILYSDNIPYFYYDSEYHSYLFRIANQETYDKLCTYKKKYPNISFDYSDEIGYTINGKQFKIVLDTEIGLEYSIYVFEEKTKMSIIRITVDGVVVNVDISKIIEDYKVQPILFGQKWVETTDFPNEFKEIIESSQVLLRLRKVGEQGE